MVGQALRAERFTAAGNADQRFHHGKIVPAKDGDLKNKTPGQMEARAM
jgi:hypothetical protein